MPKGNLSEPLTNYFCTKFEELKLLNDKRKAHILIVSETKIDRSYSDDKDTGFIAKIEPKEEAGSSLTFLQPYSLKN